MSAIAGLDGNIFRAIVVREVSASEPDEAGLLEDVLGSLASVLGFFFSCSTFGEDGEKTETDGSPLSSGDCFSTGAVLPGWRDLSSEVASFTRLSFANRAETGSAPFGRSCPWRLPARPGIGDAPRLRSAAAVADVAEPLLARSYASCRPG